MIQLYTQNGLGLIALNGNSPKPLCSLGVKLT